MIRVIFPCETPWEGIHDCKVLLGGLVFSKIREAEKKPLPLAVDFQMYSAQDNLYGTVAYILDPLKLIIKSMFKLPVFAY